jgi:hypothetical protein
MNAEATNYVGRLARVHEGDTRNQRRALPVVGRHWPTLASEVR